jgi:hypothetical protein
METRAHEQPPRRHELAERRKQWHGKRRELHERLAAACEDFVLGDLTRAHKRSILVRELRYLLDYYKDDEVWQGVE